MHTHANDHNHSKSAGEQAKLIVEKITACMAEKAFFRAMDRWSKSHHHHLGHSIREAYGKQMNRKAARWNWFSKLDPELTMFVVIMLFGAAWVLRTVWVMQ